MMTPSFSNFLGFHNRHQNLFFRNQSFREIFIDILFDSLSFTLSFLASTIPFSFHGVLTDYTGKEYNINSIQRFEYPSFLLKPKLIVARKKRNGRWFFVLTLQKLLLLLLLLLQLLLLLFLHCTKEIEEVVVQL